jgi:hypothetical protein
MKNVFLLLAAVMWLAGCVDYPPSYEYVEGPIAPARETSFEMQVAEGTAVGVVIVANDHSRFDGASAATDARSRDESIARVVPSSREGNAHSGAVVVPGKVFVIYGIASGETQIDVFLDGESKGSLMLTVVPQAP